MASFITLSGLPGVGKTTVARALARRIKAVHLRVDSLETAIEASCLDIQEAGDAGYLALAAVAKDNLSCGLNVIADTVNSLAITRNLFADCSASCGADLVLVELVCSDLAEHRRRVESRKSDLPGHTVPTWQDVAGRFFAPCEEEHRVRLDTSVQSPEDCVDVIQKALRNV